MKDFTFELCNVLGLNGCPTLWCVKQNGFLICVCPGLHSDSGRKDAEQICGLLNGVISETERETLQKQIINARNAFDEIASIAGAQC